MKKKYMYPNVNCSTICNIKDMKATKISIDRWMNTEDVVYTYVVLLSHKKEWSNDICSNVDGHRNDHTKWSKSDRERQIYDMTHMENKKLYKWTYLYSIIRLTEKKIMVTKKGRVVGGEIN